jgi:hypothetical protein
MNNYKGAGIFILKKIFAQRGKEFEAAFLAKLPPETAQVYSRTLAFQWLPVETVAQFFIAAAGIIHRDLDQGLFEIGRQQSLDQLSGIYRPLLRVCTVNFAVQQSGRVWKNYFDQGVVTVTQNPVKKEVNFRLTDFPDLPRANRLVVGGFLVGVLELTNAKNVAVRHQDGEPQNWQWILTWN